MPGLSVLALDYTSQHGRAAHDPRGLLRAVYLDHRRLSPDTSCWARRVTVERRGVVFEPVIRRQLCRDIKQIFRFRWPLYSGGRIIAGGGCP